MFQLLRLRAPANSHRRAMTILCVVIASLVGCGQAREVTHPEPVANKLPPGFLDEAPAPPTSNTLVLSGGTLVLDTLIEDAVLVVSDGRVVAWGKRGEVDVPNDSVGHDMRGKWLMPGSSKQASRQLASGDVAQFLILAHPPANDPPMTDNVIGTLAGNVVDLFEAE